MSQVISSLKQENLSYSLLVENVSEEGLLEHDHITLNTTIYCVSRQQVDKRNFIHEPMTIFLHKLIVQAMKNALSRP